VSAVTTPSSGDRCSDIDDPRGGTGRPAYSCAFPPSARIVDHARTAEQLGYRRIWLFDSPALYGDVWMALGRVAEATRRIGLGTGVAIPSLRHPLATASAIATVEELSPGRLVAAFGTGFTARLAMGRKPMKWADLARYVRQVRALLAGEVVEVDGAPCQMLHVPGWGPPRPIEVPLWVAPGGPKGFEVARSLADGVIVSAVPDRQEGAWGSVALLVFGTVVRPGEDHTGRRLIEAAGPCYATGFHAAWEYSPEALGRLPGGSEWLARVEADRPPGERHLAVHEGHLTVVTDRDRPAVEAAGPAILGAGWTGAAASIAARFDDVGAAGVTEVVYMAAGPDIPGELEAFAAAAGADR
jgi:5,10-methylenetetrahydromethanopterin reductase